MTDKKASAVLCNCLIMGMGNIPIGFIAEDYNEVLQRLHAEDENDRYCDGYTQDGLPFRVYQRGLAGIGPKSHVVKAQPAIIMPGQH